MHQRIVGQAPFRFGIRGLLIALALFAVALAFWRLFIEPVRYAVLETLCDSNLYKIRHALVLYEARHGTLPPARTVSEQGEPTHSWRVLVLPCLDSWGISPSFLQKYDQGFPWDDPANLAAVEAVHDNRYACPCGWRGKSRHTSYVVVVGPNTLFPDGGGVSSSALPDEVDPILAIEIDGDDYLWTEPRDITVDELADGLRERGAGPRLSTRRHDGIHYITLRGNYGVLDSETPPEKLKKMCEINHPTP